MSDFNWFLPLLIFVGRFLDVTLGTLRIIFIGKGKRLLAPLLGAIEVFIWVAVISQLVKNASNVIGYLAYAAGFAAGTYLGMVIETKLALGTLVIRAIVKAEIDPLIQSLKNAGYGFTYFDAQGSTGAVKILYAVIHRNELEDVVGLLHTSHPQIFYTVEETRMAKEGVFHPQPLFKLHHIGLKGKK